MSLRDELAQAHGPLLDEAIARALIDEINRLRCSDTQPPVKLGPFSKRVKRILDNLPPYEP